MIRAILKKGKIQPLDELPAHWHDGQELLVESGAPRNIFQTPERERTKKFISSLSAGNSYDI